MSEIWTILGLLLVKLIRVLSIPVDNSVLGSPEVVCSDSSVSVLFKTLNAFRGHVYVKNYYTAAGCRTDETGLDEAGIEIPFNECGSKRIRSANPRGIFVEATVIITFHPQFITKVDRAYAVQCFYMEAEKTVTAEIQVSMLTTQLFTAAVAMPACRYEVLAGGVDGEAVRYARIGDPVYHKWTCSGPQDQMFCMNVHSCFVNDGAGQRIQLLDDSGCAIDKYLLGNLEYQNDVIAFREAHVFKYADKPTLYFDCQVKLVMREGGLICQRPQCYDPPRVRRSIDNSTDTDVVDVEVDVSAEPVTVLDLETGKKDDSTFEPLADRTPRIFGNQYDFQQPLNDEKFCMSKSGFGAFIIMTGAILVCCFISVVVVMKRLTSMRKAENDLH